MTTLLPPGGYTDVSIDLETLGTSSDSVITQIGMCAFRRGFPYQSVCFHIDPQSALDAGMRVQWSTIAWWMQQSDAARMKLVSSDPMSLRNALGHATGWLLDFAPTAQVWGNGATFDVSLLENAYARLHLVHPWHYRKVRDLRTLKELADPDGTMELESPVVAHDAEADAVAQAKWIEAYRAKITIGLTGLQSRC